MKREKPITKLADLMPDPRNANKGTKRGAEMLEDSLRRYGAGRSILVDRKGRVIAGNKTVEQAGQIGLEDVVVVQTDGRKIVAVQRTDLDLERDKSARELAIADNRVGELDLEWDEDVLRSLADDIDLSRFWSDLQSEIADGKTGAGSLAERFGVPPFSVLDARQGWWQDRKRAWLALGIKSELGRGDTIGNRQNDASEGQKRYNAIPGGGGGGAWGAGGHKGQKYRKPNATPTGSPMPAANYGKTGARGDGKGRPMARSYKGQESLNAISRQRQNKDVRTGMAFRTTTDPYRSPEGDVTAEQSATSIFDPVLCELVYRWFAPATARILDPFAGGSVRGIVAAKMGHKYVGIELRPEQVEANRAQAKVICPKAKLEWIEGDAAEQASRCAGEFDLVFTCPPYGDLEQYSDDERDLSAMPHDEFLAQYNAIVAAAVNKLKPNRFACFVVGDFRTSGGSTGTL